MTRMLWIIGFIVTFLRFTYDAGHYLHHICPGFEEGYFF